MAIFYSPNRIQFGAPLAAPAAHRPAEAGFVHGTVPRGYPFCLTWTYESGAVGYHVFRSQSISQIRPQMMLNFWRGSYGEGVTHFVIGEPTDTVIDNYRLRDATQMFYWVLSQDAAGHLRPVKNLQVRMADDFASARQHILLEPGRRNATAPIQAPEPPTQPVPRASPQQPSFEPMVPTVSDDDPFLAPSRSSRPNPRPQPQAPPAQRPAPRPATRPAPQPAQSLRQVFFVTYTAPAIFQIQPPGPVANYAIYIGTQIPPTPQMADAMWDGVLQPGHPMRRYTLPGQVQGFSDRHHPPGQQAYLAIFATLPDGTIIQPELVIPPTPPAAMADLT